MTVLQTNSPSSPSDEIDNVSISNLPLSPKALRAQKILEEEAEKKERQRAENEAELAKLSPKTLKALYALDKEFDKKQAKTKTARDLLIFSERSLRENEYYRAHQFDVIDHLGGEKFFVKFYMNYNAISFDDKGNTVKNGQLYVVSFNDVLVELRWWRANYMIPKQIVEGGPLHQILIFNKSELQDQFLALQAKHLKKVNDELIKSLAFTGPNGSVSHFLKCAIVNPTPVDESVLKHWLWSIKRKIAGLSVANHICPVFYGQQGSGKTRAIEFLISPVKHRSAQKTLLESVDSRGNLGLAQLLVNFFEELSGAHRADIEQLKSIITSETLTYRPMGSNSTVSVRNDCSFIAASNYEVSTMIRDETGNRRFYQFTSLPKMVWEKELGGYLTLSPVELWLEVDEGLEEGYLTGSILSEVRKIQNETVRTKSVTELWLEDENMQFSEKDQGYRTQFISNSRLYLKFKNWCEDNGHKLIPNSIIFGKNLSKICTSQQRKVGGINEKGRYVIINQD